jgi:ATP-dependent DNA helicase DinG
VHRLEDVTTQQFGSIFDPRALREFLNEISNKDINSNFSLENTLKDVIKNLPNIDKKLLNARYERIHTAADESVRMIKTYIQQLRKFAREHYENDKRPRRFDLVLSKVNRSYSDWIELEESTIELDVALEFLNKNLQEIDAIIDAAQSEIHNSISSVLVQLRKINSIVNDYRLCLGRAVLHQMPDDIVWISVGEGELKIKSAPLDVAPILHESLFANLHSVVGTSATIRANDSFNITANRLGFSDVDTIEIQSPFNYQDHVLVLVIDDIPDPNHIDYQAELSHLITEASMTSRGRTLTLFTSHNSLRNTANMLRAEFSANNLNLLAQGLDGSPRRLIRRLQEDPESVIFGTSAFWEGVDIPGDTLSQIILTRLPFPVPSDPIFMGRAEQYQDPFSEYTLPQTILKFRQGFGRLVRRSTDRGVFIIADSRVSNRSYGSLFLDALPNPEIRHVAVSDVRNAVHEWLSK